MKKIKCLSVRVESIREVSEKAVLIKAFDGSSDIFPKSAIIAEDFEVEKCRAFWIAEWILPKKSLQFSYKKSKWFEVN